MCNSINLLKNHWIILVYIKEIEKSRYWLDEDTEGWKMRTEHSMHKDSEERKYFDEFEAVKEI